MYSRAIQIIYVYIYIEREREMEIDGIMKQYTSVCMVDVPG